MLYLVEISVSAPAIVSTAHSPAGAVLQHGFSVAAIQNPQRSPMQTHDAALDEIDKGASKGQNFTVPFALFFTCLSPFVAARAALT